MKQVVVISGKGGTGKTVITASFAALAKNKVMADCDVDAADLHLLLSPKIEESHEFKSGVTAFIHRDKCNQCGLCKKICRFSAIGGSASGQDAVEGDFIIDSVSCEGCAFCSFICPQGAIEMKENTSGEWFSSTTRFGPMVHAKLGIAEENSGKLVSLVRKKAQEKAEEINADWIIIDGSPGIGCPVIASITAVDCALIVTEPTLSGLHDAARVVEVAKHFKVPVKLIINKYDLNIDMTEEIERYCREKAVQIVGKLGFDKKIVKAMVEGKTIVEYSDGESSKQIKRIWARLKEELSKENNI